MSKPRKMYVIADAKGLLYLATPDFAKAADYVGRLCKFDSLARDTDGATPDYYRIVDVNSVVEPAVMKASKA